MIGFAAAAAAAAARDDCEIKFPFAISKNDHAIVSVVRPFRGRAAVSSSPPSSAH